jgi:hypothetical protein
MVINSVCYTHHRQNPIESTKFFMITTVRTSYEELYFWHSETIYKRLRGSLSCGVVTAQVFVTSPYDLPLLGTDVTSGSTAQVSLSAQVTYTTPQVHDLSLERRGCKYENEGEALGFPYRHGNCIAQCHRDSTVLNCDCSPYFFPTEGKNLLPHVAIVISLCEWIEVARVRVHWRASLLKLWNLLTAGCLLNIMEVG